MSESGHPILILGQPSTPPLVVSGRGGIPLISLRHVNRAWGASCSATTASCGCGVISATVWQDYRGVSHRPEAVRGWYEVQSAEARAPICSALEVLEVENDWRQHPQYRDLRGACLGWERSRQMRCLTPQSEIDGAQVILCCGNSLAIGMSPTLVSARLWYAARRCCRNRIGGFHTKRRRGRWAHHIRPSGYMAPHSRWHDDDSRPTALDDTKWSTLEGTASRPKVCCAKRRQLGSCPN